MRRVKVEAGDFTVSLEGVRELVPWREWMYVPDAVVLRDELDKAIHEAVKLGRARQEQSEHALKGCCRS